MKQFRFGKEQRRCYNPISNYGIIGDQSTAAFVGVDGSIDWCCMPQFDSPAIFASLLDVTKGGCWSIEPLTEYYSEQRYVPNTNVLFTTFCTETGRAELCDFMPRFPDSDVSSVVEIHRRLTGLEGEVRMKMTFEPRPDFARSHVALTKNENGCSVDSERINLSLSTNQNLKIENDSLAIADFLLTDGNVIRTVCTYGSRETTPIQDLQSEEKLDKTIRFWRNWVNGLRYDGPWREAVIRSALVLKLLTFKGTNAIVAAPTTSLPEVVGGSRNWDYRYSWVRDSCFSIWAFKLLEDDSKEATGYLDWLMKICRTSFTQGLGHSLRIMYGIRGETMLDEAKLDNLRVIEAQSP